jgi:hypothetical protein
MSCEQCEHLKDRLNELGGKLIDIEWALLRYEPICDNLESRLHDGEFVNGSWLETFELWEEYCGKFEAAEEAKDHYADEYEQVDQDYAECKADHKCD